MCLLCIFVVLMQQILKMRIAVHTFTQSFLALTVLHSVLSMTSDGSVKNEKKESLREKYKCCIHAMSAKWEGKENLVVTPSTFPKLATFVVLQVKPDTNILCLN